MNEEKYLTRAMIKLIEGNGNEAVEAANFCPGSWVARCISSMACSFFLFEPTAGIEALGGLAEVQKLMQSERAEKYFLRGNSARFRKEPEAALADLRKAAELDPDNPFIQFSLMLVCAEQGLSDELQQTITLFIQAHPKHPLLVTMGNMFGAVKG